MNRSLPHLPNNRGVLRQTPRRRDGVCFVMSYVKPEPASGDVYLWSPVPGSVLSGYHKIRGSVTEHGATATSWGRSGAYEIAEVTIYKLSYQFRGSLARKSTLLENADPCCAHHQTFDEKQNFSLPGYLYLLTRGGLISVMYYRHLCHHR